MNKRMVHVTLAAAVAASLATPLGIGVAVAQEVTGLEEVVVTARKREENIQDVAIAMSALSQTEIAGILGASRPKINRFILSLEEQGAIKRKGNVIDCNIPRLEALAEPDDD